MMVKKIICSALLSAAISSASYGYSHALCHCDEGPSWWEDTQFYCCIDDRDGTNSWFDTIDSTYRDRANQCTKNGDVHFSDGSGTREIEDFCRKNCPDHVGTVRYVD